MASVDCEMDFLPRVGERIVLDMDGPRVFRIKDVEYRLAAPSQTSVVIEDDLDTTPIAV